jgi:hypothetical protein
MWDGRNRRSFHRRRTSIRAVLKVGDRALPGVVRDISRGGVFLEAEAVLEADEGIDAEALLFLRAAEPAYPVRISWWRPPGSEPGGGYGLRFVTWGDVHAKWPGVRRSDELPVEIDVVLDDETGPHALPVEGALATGEDFSVDVDFESQNFGVDVEFETQRDP